jgi:hypothetical protein
MPVHTVLRNVGSMMLLTVLLLGSAACASAAPRGRVYLRVGPPAPIVETRIVAPGPGYVWVPGFYRWERAGYVWVPGRWDRPPRARAVWVPARWVHNRRGWYVIEGRWR